MKKFINHISYIEIAIAAFIIVVCMFFPVLHCEAVSVNTNVNSWIAIAGIKDANSKIIPEITTFSFLCLLPYLLLALSIVLNILFDNKHNIVIDLVKVLLYIVIALLFINYLNLLTPADYFSSYDDLLTRFTPKWGHYFMFSLTIIMILIECLGLLNDIKLNKGNKED